MNPRKRLRKWIEDEFRKSLYNEVDRMVEKMKQEGWETDEELENIKKEFVERVEWHFRYLKERIRSFTFKEGLR